MKREIILTASFFFATGFVMAKGSPSQIINIKTFGAIGNGVANDAIAINNAIADAVKLGPGATVLIPKGRYLLESSNGFHVDISGAHGLTIRGEKGAVLIATNPDDNIIRMSKCVDTTLENLTLEQKKTYFTQGVIDSIAPDGMSCDVTIEKGYDDPDSPHLAPDTTLRSFSYPDTTIYRQDRWWPTVKSYAGIGDHRWRLVLDGWAVTPDMVKRSFIIWDDKHGSHGMDLESCSDCLVRDVTYYGKGTNAGLYLANCNGTITFRRFDILTPPGSNALLSCSGGGQMVDCRGRLVFDHCRYDKVDDDGADIFTGYARVLSQVNPRTLVVQGDRNYQVNDKVALLDWITRVNRSTASIVNVIHLDDGNTRLVLDGDVKAVRMGAGSGSDWKKAYLDGVDRITDYNLACSSVLFRDCSLQALRARALNLKARNCTVEGCTFHDCSMPAISAGPEFWWGEGPAVHNLTIRNNTFINCNTRCIDIGAWDAGSLCRMRDNSNIIIEGNTFKKYGEHPTVFTTYLPQCSIAVAYADRVIIRGNIFNPPTDPTKVKEVVLKDCDHVTFDDNHNLKQGDVVKE